MTTTTRIRAALAALLLTLAVLLAAAPPADPDTPAAAFTISGLDLHDAQIVQDGDQYVMVGSMYGCGYQWYIANTPWCGFGASTAPTPQGPWSAPVQLFSPASTDPSTGQTWQATCGQTGQGCFNPKVIQRTGWGSDDGVWILYFNAPRQYNLGAAHALNAMGCNSPTGPCGPTAGAPSGSYTKPSLPFCAGANGDFGVVTPPVGRPAIVCTEAGATSLAIQELNWWGTGGTSTGVAAVPGVSGIEGPGGWYDPASGRYVLTFSDPYCGYCAGTQAGYADSPGLYSGWGSQGNVGWSATANGRRAFSANTCGGQARTVTVLDGQPYQVIDLWVGNNGAPQRNQTAADTHVVPLEYEPRSGVPGDGAVWRPAVSMTC